VDRFAASIVAHQCNLLEQTNPDLTVPGFLSMMLQGDKAFSILSKSWKVFELALGNQLL
jgi:hypothetical protein